MGCEISYFVYINVAAVYRDDFVIMMISSNFDEHSSENEEELDEIEDEEVDDEEELPFCICGMPNNDEMIACEQRNCRVQCRGVTGLFF